MRDPATHPSSSSPAPLETPVLFLVFNRPELTERVFAEIRRARPATLLLVADGPRAERAEDRDRCAAVRAIVGRVDWPCVVRTNFSETNLGCRARIASGLRWAFAQVPEAIVLEDDCLPHPDFFAYCAELLAHYRDDPRIGMIAGTNYRPAGPRGEASYFASRHHSIWGWATWRRAFDGYDERMPTWRTSVFPRNVRPAASHRRMHWLHTAMFDHATRGACDTWDIAWTYHLARRDAWSLVPTANLISNLGIEGTRGRAGDTNNLLPVSPLSFPLRHPAQLTVDEAYDRAVTGRHRLVRDWWRARLAHRVRALLRLGR